MDRALDRPSNIQIITPTGRQTDTAPVFRETNTFGGRSYSVTIGNGPEKLPFPGPKHAFDSPHQRVWAAPTSAWVWLSTLGTSGTHGLINFDLIPVRPQKSSAAVVWASVLSNVLDEGRTLLLSNLRSIQEECSSDDWDGYGAEAISKKTLDRAILLLSELPLNIPAPEPGAEPDGGLSLEWYARRGRYISVSVGPDDRAVGIDLDGDQIESWSGDINRAFAMDLARRIRALDIRAD